MSRRVYGNYLFSSKESRIATNRQTSHFTNNLNAIIQREIATNTSYRHAQNEIRQLNEWGLNEFGTFDQFPTTFWRFFSTQNQLHTFSEKIQSKKFIFFYSKSQKNFIEMVKVAAASCGRTNFGAKWLLSATEISKCAYCSFFEILQKSKVKILHFK